MLKNIYSLQRDVSFIPTFQKLKVWKGTGSPDIHDRGQAVQKFYIVILRKTLYRDHLGKFWLWKCMMKLNVYLHFKIYILPDSKWILQESVHFKDC